MNAESDQSAFYRLLHRRGLTTTDLAELAGTGRAHLTEVINNKPGHGHFTRRRLFTHLTAEEVRLLGWSDEYNRWRRKKRRAALQSVRAMDVLASRLPRSTRNIVPISTLKTTA